MYIVLCEDLATFGPELDRGRQLLVDMANAIVEARGPDAPSRMTDALTLLIRSADRQIQGEEALMEAAAFGRSAPHRRRHRQFVERLAEVQRSLSAQQDIVAAQLALHHVFLHWVRDHVQRDDARLARWLDKRRVRLAREEEEAQDSILWARQRRPELRSSVPGAACVGWAQRGTAAK